MRDLLTDPAWKPDDLGLPLPDSPHACSVALPCWDHVIGYEENRSDIIDRMQCGYPRFFWNPTVDRLFSGATARFASGGDQCLVFPSEFTAARCSDFLREKGIEGVAVHDLGRLGLHATTLPPAGWDWARRYWRYSGEIVSSRQANAYLADRPAVEAPDAIQAVTSRLAARAGVPPHDVFLFPSGMAAVFAVHRMVLNLFPGRKSIQVGFPYVDVLHVQQHFGPGVHFFLSRGPEDVRDIVDCVQHGAASAVFCEVATNPLLQSPDVESIVPAARAHDIPVVIDDTIASSINLDVLPMADVVTASLTKYFSGAGDVMAGCVILRAESPFYADFAAFLSTSCESWMWGGDAAALEKNSRDYPQRMATINANAQALYEYLATVPGIDKVLYPAVTTPDWYRQMARPGGGNGGLMSILFKEPEGYAPPFYDALRVSKGPSLGTNFSLVCPYTLLAHYDELDWAESCGVPRHLVRIAVGLEPAEELIDRFREALDAAR